MTFYHHQIAYKSQVFVFDLCISDINKEDVYSIQYQLMEKEGDITESYYQSRPITKIESEYLIKSIDIKFSEKNIPEFIIELFYENIKIGTD